MSAEEKSYVVFGASGGIGSATARELRARGHRVLLAGRSREPLASLSEELDAPNAVLDARSWEEVLEACRRAQEELGGVDGIANCVGNFLMKPAHLTTSEEWSETLALNLGSAFACVRAAAEILREGGAVVLVASAAASVGLANHEAIAAAKAGVAGMTRSAAATHAARGIRFNAVAPGLVKTGLTRRIWERGTARAASESMHALGRLGEPEDVASAIVWLLEPRQSWITGQVIGIDGGLAEVRPRPRG